MHGGKQPVQDGDYLLLEPIDSARAGSIIGTTVVVERQETGEDQYHPLKEDTALDDQNRIEIEAAAFRGLVEHLQRRTDVQNIDLMNLAGFCRNCLSKWYLAAAAERGVELDYAAACEAVYGMPYADWKQRYQREASPEQQQAFEATKPLHAYVSGHHKG